MEELESVALFDAFPDPIFLQRESVLRYCNPAAKALFPDAAVGAPLPEALAHLTPNAVTALELGGCSYTAQADKKGDLMVLRRQAALPVSLEKLADQLRQKMSNLLAASGLLAPTVERSGDENALRYLATLNQSLYRMLRMVGDLDLAGKMGGEESADFAPITMDLAGFCHQLAESVYPLAETAGVSFSYDSAADSLISNADEALLRRMLLALISNAMLAAGQGGAVHLRLARDQKFVRFTVSDNGPGLAPGGLATYFDGGEENVASPNTGLGLGMKLVRYGAQLHGGTVMAESREGDGVRCTLSIPLKKGKGNVLKSAPPKFQREGGFSPVLLALSDALPWQAFLPADLE